MVNRKASSQPKPPAALLKLTSSKVKHVASELGFLIVIILHTRTHAERDMEMERERGGRWGKLASGAQNQMFFKNPKEQNGV